MLANLCRSNNKPEDGSYPASPLSFPLSLALFLSPAQTHLHANSLDLPWCQCVCVCVQSKVSNNVSGRMCLAIEIYLHYYSVLTMRLGSSIPPVPYCSPTVFQSPRTVFDLRSRCLDLWVARQLVKPCLRQHGQACTQRQHLSRWLLSRSSSLCALLFRLPCCAVFFWSSVFSHLPELLSSFSYQDSIRAA